MQRSETSPEANRGRPSTKEAVPGRSDSVLRLMLLGYLLVAVLYASRTPAWQAPDEPAHYNYARFLAEEGRLPELLPGDYPGAYLEELKAARFPAAMSIDSLRYEFHQPPLYYLLASLVYRLADSLGRLSTPLMLRYFTVLIGALALLFGYRVVRTLYPHEPAVSLGAAAFWAWLPMHLAMTSSINSDALAELVLNVVVWKLVAMGADAWTNRRAFGLGALLGLALLAKFQSYAAVGVALAALALDACSWRRDTDGLTWRRALLRAAIMLGTAALVVSPWIVRNVTLYGPGDPLGLLRHDAVVAGQLTTKQYIAGNGWLGWARAFALTTFHSFWGQFGWMGVPLPARVYEALAVLSGLAVVGLVAYLWRLRRGHERLSATTGRGLVLLLVWAGIAVAGYLWWNVRYVQHQGRYLFPALVAWSTAFALGMREVLRKGYRVGLVALALAAGTVIILSIISADLKLFSLVLLLGAAVLLALGHWLERRHPGWALGALYGGLGAFAALCVYAYITPALTP